ncbi:hypothetical protein ACFQQB_59580 [Nonomuraea rubra]|uniref:hypothetical protein n=1 Tax=Nonomuraea rubra TaxID=46180 RepID=UPI00360D698A
MRDGLDHLRDGAQVAGVEGVVDPAHQRDDLLRTPGVPFDVGRVEHHAEARVPR